MLSMMYQALTMYRGLTEMNFQQWRVGVALATGMGLAFVTAVPFQFVAWAQSSGDRMRIAVLDFDFGSTGAAGGYFGGAEARGVNEILVNRLVQDGTYSVIERSQLDAILQEQDLGASGRVDANTAAQIGRILGVDAIVTGTVTEYNLDQQVSGGSVGFFGVSAATDDKTATVKLNARMIGTSTAEILVAAEGEGIATQSDSQVLVLGTGGGSQTNNVQKLLSEATEQAIDGVMEELVSAQGQLAALPTAVPDVSATVADVFGSEITLNKGSAAGLRPGMIMSVEQVVREVIDPETGDVLRKVTQPIGELELVEVSDRSSVGRTLSGVFNVGDVAKPVSDKADAGPNLLDYQE